MNKRILIIDDEAEILFLLEDILEMAGYQVTTADGAHSAIEMIKSKEFDFILSDVKMPKGSGHDLLKYLNELDKEIKVLLMSGFSDLSNDDAKKLGSLGIVKKPFDLYGILALIKNELETDG